MVALNETLTLPNDIYAEIDSSVTAGKKIRILKTNSAPSSTPQKACPCQPNINWQDLERLAQSLEPIFNEAITKVVHDLNAKLAEATEDNLRMPLPSSDEVTARTLALIRNYEGGIKSNNPYLRKENILVGHNDGKQTIDFAAFSGKIKAEKSMTDKMTKHNVTHCEITDYVRSTVITPTLEDMPKVAKTLENKIFNAQDFENKKLLENLGINGNFKLHVIEERSKYMYEYPNERSKNLYPGNDTPANNRWYMDHKLLVALEVPLLKEIPGISEENAYYICELKINVPECVITDTISHKLYVDVRSFPSGKEVLAESPPQPELSYHEQVKQLKEDKQRKNTEIALVHIAGFEAYNMRVNASQLKIMTAANYVKKQAAEAYATMFNEKIRETSHAQP